MTLSQIPWRHSARLLLLGALVSTAALAQISQDAFRVLGQPDLRRNGNNGVTGAELTSPSGVAIDERDGSIRVYVADSGNNRVLAWADAVSYTNGAPADLVLGQPNLELTIPLGIGVRGFVTPAAVAINPANGDVYVADTGNSRILRFPAPFANASRVEPDRVYGQPNFNQRNPNTGGLSERTMNQPGAITFGPNGNLFVSDSGNHRVLRYPVSALDADDPFADLVIGQPDFNSGGTNFTMGGAPNAQGFNVPSGIRFDSNGDLYVTDVQNVRVVIFAAGFATGAMASAVVGQDDLVTVTLPPGVAANKLRFPADIALDSADNLWVSIPSEHRVMRFPSGGDFPEGTADLVIGQTNLANDQRNQGTDPQASNAGFFAPSGLAFDGRGTIYVCDTFNNRVVAYPNGTREANQVYGQENFQDNGANRVDASSINGAFDVAIDYSADPPVVYASDANNNRVLGWRNANRFENGAPADIIIGQPDARTVTPNTGTGAALSPSPRNFLSPRGITVDPQGNLLVADSGNNRVLRFPRPYEQQGQPVADIVIGQQDFFSDASAAVNAASLRAPAGVTINAEGTLYVADSANHRVLEYPAPLATGMAAARVFGQPSFTEGSRPSEPTAQRLAGPEGVHADAFGFLYVADTLHSRVLVFPNVASAPTFGASAAIVAGQPDFGDSTARISPSGMAGPRAVSTDAEGRIYIADSLNSRVLVFPSIIFLPIAGAEAEQAVGQPSLQANRPNFNTPDGFATPEGLFQPVGVTVDRQGTLYVADTGNSRVLHFLRPAAGVNAAHFLPRVPVAPGSLVSLFGTEFIPGDPAVAAALPLPTELADRKLEINDSIPVPLLFVAATQSNVQIPLGAEPGRQRISVRDAQTDELVAGSGIDIAASGPGLFTTNQAGTGQALALNEDGTRNTPENPAAVGSVVVLFGTGPGATNPPVPDGQAAPSSPLAVTVANPTQDDLACLTQQPAMCVAVAAKFAEVLFSGMAPGFVGLWQINVRIPDGIVTGDDITTRVIINGTPALNVDLAIR